MGPIRILQIIRQMNQGGAENFIMNVYRNIDKEKVQFDFLVYKTGVFDDEIKKMGGRIYYGKYITEIGQHRYCKELKEFFTNHPEYNIIHSHLDQVSGIILEVANKVGISVRISHSHNTRNTNSLLGKIYKKYLQSKINKNATVLMACGEEAAKWLFREKANEAIIVPNGIDLKRYKYDENIRKKIRKELHIDENTIVCGHIGRFSKQKNHKFLIEIFKEYQNINSNSKMILVGDGQLRKQIEKQIKRQKLQKSVMLLGKRKDSENLYQAFDLLLFPSLFEGMSLVTLEAQAEGLPILCSDTIDRKTDITKTIEFISLKEPAKHWAEKIENMDKSRNIKNNEILSLTDYNISILSRKMEDKYIELCEGKKYENYNNSNTNL